MPEGGKEKFLNFICAGKKAFLIAKKEEERKRGGEVTVPD